MAFDLDELVRFIDDDVRVAPFPRKLEIAVNNARQIFPKVKESVPPANLLLLAAGTIRFGPAGDNPLEDDTNQSSEFFEVDGFEGGDSRTVKLVLDDLVNHPADALLGSASFAALANGGFTTDDDNWLVGTENAVSIVDKVLREGEPESDICLLSDVTARGRDVDFPNTVADAASQLNRSGFQVTALLLRPPGA